MNREEHPSLILADMHVIPILLYVGENGGCTRTELYLEVARSANTPSHGPAGMSWRGSARSTD